MSGIDIEDIRRRLVGQLRRRQRTAETLDEIAARFRDFESALGTGDVRSLLRATTYIHYLVLRLVGAEEADALCDRLQELVPASVAAAGAPLRSKRIFFVWIGAIGIRSLRNILIWKRANPQCAVELWYDSGCLLASDYSRLLRDRAGLGLTTNSDVVRFQNRVYADLLAGIGQGRTFDEALIEFFLRFRDGSIGRKLAADLERARRVARAAARHVSLIDVRDYAREHMDDEIRGYYFREIALRANLASASDILRLSVLHRLGGIYVDCDTLPALDHVYVRTAEYCRRKKIAFSFIDVLKSEAYLQKVAPLVDPADIEPEAVEEAAGRQADLRAITEHLRQGYGELVALVEQDAAAITPENAFRPLGEVRLCDQGLLLTGDPHNPNGFNNNVIIANPGSKAIRIILREMRHRYRYLERMGAIDVASEEDVPRDESYRGRLLNYRFDALDDKPNVTVILTGPGLIFETVMGLGFSLLKLDDDVPPLSLSCALYSRKIGIAFMDQTFHTYDHSRSAWMKGDDGALLV